MRLQDFDTGEKFNAKVLENLRITSKESSEEVRELTLEVDNLSFTFQPGQSIGVIVPGSEEIGHQHHFRLYTLADVHQHSHSGNPLIKLCVKRCHYIDEYSGEEYNGLASNFLCDTKPGDNIDFNGPHGLPFSVPEDKSADLLLIGMGTGIAPFRAFLKHIYHNVGDWQGRIRLFYGAHTGLEMLYMNDQKNDVTQYYDEDTFEAIQSLSPRAHWSSTVDFYDAMDQRAEEILEILSKDNGYVYVAGRLDIEQTLDQIFSEIAGSEEAWQDLQAKLVEQNRWQELIY